MTSALNLVLFTSIWLSVGLFVVGEVAKRPGLRGGVPPRAAWAWWAAGAFLCGVHIALAMALRHGWNHQSAFDATAHQTYQIYGVAWGGGLYVNVVFLAAWLGELLWWRISPDQYFARPAFVTWLLRGFYFVILANAAIVFAVPSRRVGGVVLLAILLLAWRPNRGAADRHLQRAS